MNEEIMKKIDAFLELPDGWHYGEGHAPSKGTVKMAKKVYDQFNTEKYEIEVFPGIWGEIMIEIYPKDNEDEKYGEITVMENCMITVGKCYEDILKDEDYDEINEMDEACKIIEEYLRR